MDDVYIDDVTQEWITHYQKIVTTRQIPLNIPILYSSLYKQYPTAPPKTHSWNCLQQISAIIDSFTLHNPYTSCTKNTK